ncbi:hypothetical protein [Photobacterium sp. GB-1]|uniref:hypothetical protein n=1 Tax=Photobacterium sp. GB-1 TaxID=2022111 RepID=UPI000D166E92|nr:hypothetical protein [Photobacterium sp. GB-1]PSV54500.1 hypothetical protein C9J45_02795 [Photobacterium sp. GB-1]
MMKIFVISLFFSSALHAAPSLHHLDYSIDFHNKYGTDGLLISSPNIQFIYKEIDRHCYKIVRDRSARIYCSQANNKKCLLK